MEVQAEGHRYPTGYRNAVADQSSQCVIVDDALAKTKARERFLQGMNSNLLRRCLG